jgi:hypothetical protein
VQGHDAGRVQARVCVREQQMRTFLVLRPCRERVVVEPQRRGEGAEADGTVAGSPECDSCPGLEPGVGRGGRPREVERGAVVVGHQLGVVILPPQALDPRRRAQMLLRALAARNLPVGDVANEHVTERVFDLAADRGAALAADQALSLQRVERVLERRRIEPGELGRAARPEHLPEHGCRKHQTFLFDGELVEACRDDGVDRLGQR